MNIDGNALYQFGQGGIISIIAIVMVFLILLLIIVLTELVTKIVEKSETKAPETNQVPSKTVGSKLNVNDEDAVVACLVASIDYRMQTGKHIEVLSVREVK